MRVACGGGAIFLPLRCFRELFDASYELVSHWFPANQFFGRDGGHRGAATPGQFGRLRMPFYVFASSLAHIVAAIEPQANAKPHAVSMDLPADGQYDDLSDENPDPFLWPVHHLARKLGTLDASWASGS